MKSLQRYLRTDIRYFFHGGSWLLGSQAVVSTCTIILTVLFANIVSIDTYGTYKYILSLIALFSLFSLSGINTALTRAVSRHFEADYNLALKTKIRWSTIGAICSLCVGAYYLMVGNQELGVSFLIVSIFLPFVDSYTLFQAYLNGKSQYKQLSLFLAYSSLINMCVVGVTLFLTENVVYIVLSYIGSKTLLNFFWSTYTLKKFPPNEREDSSLLAYGKELSFMKGLSVISGSVYSIGLWQFGGATTLATFALAIAPAEQVRTALKYIEPLVLPKTAKDSWDKRTFWWFVGKTTPLVLITICIVIVYILAAPFLFSVLFPKYMDAVFYSQLYATTLVLTAQSVVISAILKAKQKTGTLHILNVTNIITDLCISLPAIYFFSITGLIVSIIISKTILLVLGLVLLYTNKPH